MSLKKVVVAAFVVLAIGAYTPAARAAENNFSGTRVSVPSGKSFEQVVDALLATLMPRVHPGVQSA